MAWEPEVHSHAAKNATVLDLGCGNGRNSLYLAKEGMTMVVVSHEMGFVRAAADRIVFMDEGRVVEDTTPEGLFTAPKHERTKLFLSKILH